VTVTYAHDPGGPRVLKRVGSQNPTLYYGPLVELSPSGSMTKYYYADEIVARRVYPAHLISYYHKDYLGSIRLTTNAAGAVVTRNDCDAFGNATPGQRLGFTGQESDDESGLIYMDARYYEPGLGRFVSPDTIVADLLNPQAINPYSYVYNNPLSYVDPTGHQPGDPNEAPWPANRVGGQTIVHGHRYLSDPPLLDAGSFVVFDKAVLVTAQPTKLAVEEAKELKAISKVITQLSDIAEGAGQRYLATANLIIGVQKTLDTQMMHLQQTVPDYLSLLSQSYVPLPTRAGSAAATLYRMSPAPGPAAKNAP
jgi:RHS repeat-associated protein